ncbi:MAG: archaeal heat shock protein Hsp20 [Thermoplasmata archaeon]
MGDEKKRRAWPFDDDDFWDYFGDAFDEMKERMERIMSHSFDEVAEGKPFVWGYSFRVGPNGQPEFRQFGDTNVLRPWKEESGREPMTDVMDRGDTVSVTVELPGVEKKDIDLRTAADRLTIRVATPDRQYHKEVELETTVDPKSVQATYNNGVLDITLRKTAQQAGEPVNIE